VLFTVNPQAVYELIQAGGVVIVVVVVVEVVVIVVIVVVSLIANHKRSRIAL